VQQLLSYLQQRPEKTTEKARFINPTRNDDLESYLNQTHEQTLINRLDSYVELLYEDVAGKTRGTGLILQLVKSTENLEELSQNDALIGALYRVLREDGRRHYILAINIVFTFFYFATYSNFHPILTRFKVGSLLMEVIRWELQRFDQWEAELQSGEMERG